MPRDPKSITSTKGRRGNNEGSIYQRTDGRWCGQATTSYNDDGTPIRKYIYGKTRQEVAKQLAAVTNHIFALGYANTQNSDTTVELFLREWLLNFKKPQVTDATFSWYMRHANTHIIPAIGNMQLSKVETIHIQKFLNGMINNKKAARTVNGVRQTVNQMFRFAVENKILDKNPAEFTKGMSKRKEQQNRGPKAMTPEQRQAVLTAADNHAILKPMIKTLMFTGMRIGELLALRWRHIDFDKGIIAIEDAITREYDFDENGKPYNQRTLVSYTKTQASVRRILAPEIVMSTLKEHKRDKTIDEATKSLSFTAPDDFVFSTRDGKIRTYRGFTSVFDRFKKDNGLTDFELHAHTMRHTFATILLEEGENPKTVQILLGHKDIETTLGIYTHVMQQVLNDSAQKLDAAYLKLVPSANLAQIHEEDIFAKMRMLLSNEDVLRGLLSQQAV